MTAPRTSDRPGLLIIVVSYNTRDMTLACLRSVAQRTATPHRLVVVDNASSDGSPAAIREAFPEVELVELAENVGFARANNLAAQTGSEELILLLNPDTLVLEDGIDALVRFARERPEAGIWGGRTRFADGSLNPSSCWGRPTPWSITCRVLGLVRLLPGSPVFNPEAYGGWDRATERRVDIVSGCFFLITRDLWNRLDGLDPAFFMYGEEADLCLRARRLGAVPTVTPRAQIVHYGGASERHRSDKAVRLLAAKISLIRRHWSPAWRWYGVTVLGAWAWARAVADGIRRPRRPEASAGWRAVWARRAEWRSGYAGVAE